MQSVASDLRWCDEVVFVCNAVSCNAVAVSGVSVMCCVCIALFVFVNN